MALRPEIQLRQNQRLALTPGLRQSLNILQLPAAVLADHVVAEVAENPFLEYKEPFYQGAVVDHQIALETIAATPTLSQHLVAQLGLMKAPAAEVEIAQYLAWNLTDDGFLADDPWTISEDLEQPQNLVHAAAKLLQSCDPVGIGAYGLKHSLDLQLAALKINPERRKLILNNLAALTQRDDASLARDLAVSTGEIRDCRAVLKSLTPRPAERFAASPIEVQIPDMKVTVLPGSELLVEPVDRAVPQLDLDQRLFKSTTSGGHESSETLENQYQSAQQLIRAIVSRTKTILRIGERLALDQARFFLDGPSALRPMTQVEMAANLDIHPSTLSRAIAHKSLICSHGAFPLRMFFSTALPQGNDEVSAFVVQQQIAGMIRGEKPPGSLSDSQIATLLGETGVDIARRTVAKYRQCLNIPSSIDRRRSKSKL